jgi:hypothetical protein
LYEQNGLLNSPKAFAPFILDFFSASLFRFSATLSFSAVHPFPIVIIEVVFPSFSLPPLIAIITFFVFLAQFALVWFFRCWGLLLLVN